MAEVKMIFPNAEQAEAFMRFMDCYGEQVYWDWTESGEWASVNRFSYDYENRTVTGEKRQD